MRKLLTIFILLALASIAISALAGTSPFPKEGRPHGEGITHPTTVAGGSSFNNYTDGKAGLFDERVFLVVRNETTEQLYDTKGPVLVSPGDVLKISIFINNNGDSVADGLRVHLYVPFAAQWQETSIGAFLRAENAVVDDKNAEIKTIGDAITIKSKDETWLDFAYLQHSARFIQKQKDVPGGYNLYGCGYPVPEGCETTSSMDYYLTNPGKNSSIFSGAFDGKNIIVSKRVKSGVLIRSDGTTTTKSGIFDNTGAWKNGDEYAGLVQIWLRVRAADQTPPKFDGIKCAIPIGPTEVAISWGEATDNKTASADMLYDVYYSTTPGGQDFDPAKQNYSVGLGGTSFIATSLKPDTDYYFVVRARDTSGNRDGNTVERHVRTGK